MVSVTYSCIVLLWSNCAMGIVTQCDCLLVNRLTMGSTTLTRDGGVVVHQGVHIT